MTIAIAFEDRLLLSRAYGLADVEEGAALTTDHVFRIASHSKTFTATAIMQLVEQGRMRLDDRAGDLLDWLPTGAGRLGGTTIRQLLSHSAGVIRDGEDGGWWQLEREFPDLAELRSDLAATPPVFVENQQFKYSNFGYSLLGMVIEQVGGRPYNDYVRTEIVERLGLHNTGPEIDGHSRSRLATGYSVDFPGSGRLPLAHMDTHGMSSATGFYSTAEDLCRYGRAHFIGNPELLSDESKREMQHEHWKVEGAPGSYGLGFSVVPVGDRRTVGHGGGFPGFITNTKIDPVDRLVAVALTNAGDGPAAELTTGIFQIINQALKASPAGTVGAQLDRFVGRYWSLGGALDIVRFGGDLMALSPGLPNPTDPITELAPVGADDLTITSAPGYASPGERVSFKFATGGGVEYVQWAAGRYYPWDRFEAEVLAGVRATRLAPQRPPLPG